MKRILILACALFMCIPCVVAAADNQGFIYGRVVTESGAEYTGFLRWGDQEASWDDLFHSSKENLPYLEHVEEDDDDDRDKKRRRRFSFFRKWNVTVESSSRVFICRFGDIDVIEPLGDGEARLIMKNGERYDVHGYSDDVSSKIHVNDEALGDIELKWDRIERIEFEQAPAGAEPGVWRLYGTVETDHGEFQGFIQWDKHEALNIDKLDGDTEDGDVSIPMGKLRSIESDGRRGSMVTLKDGREMRLTNSNDVNHENRGIMVEDPRYGRVTIGWKVFQSLAFTDPPGSGRGYDDYKPLGKLRGTVTDESGETFKGRIVFDLDEVEGWEMLNGDMGNIDFDIPFHLIAALEPRGSGKCRVLLHNGEAVNLEDGQDVTDKNDGVLVFTDDDDEPVYIKWRDIDRIEFDKM